MGQTDLIKTCENILNVLCREIPERCVGSQGNRQATDYFQRTLENLGWNTESQVFDAVDWIDGGATLTTDDRQFKVFVSPYSLGCDVTAELVTIDSLDSLRTADIMGKLVLLHGCIAAEQLMPKNFVFYNPDSHREIISLLEKGQPAAIICATGRNASLAGGVYPFPLIEDGDFHIPSVYMTEEEGKALQGRAGQVFHLQSNSTRIPGKGENIVARKGDFSRGRIVITAHIDAKKGTPGAIDNATGVAVLLLLAESLKDYAGNPGIELVAFNGEDYYAVSGQMKYIAENKNTFDDVVMNINIDGAGYKDGPSAFSFYGLDDRIIAQFEKLLQKHPAAKVGVQWPQGDHSIFVQYGRPAIAVSSEWFTENIDSQTITHTPKDNLSIVDNQKIVEIVTILVEFLRYFPM